jgi:hypothetical protein
MALAKQLSPMKCSGLVMRVIALSLAVAPFVSAGTGCAERYIPNTDVVDTEDNRDVVAFCEQYRHAVERKDAVVMLKMISPDYYEDGGNPDASDDMDYVQFKDYLTGAAYDQTGVSFQEATAIRHEIRYRRILRENNRVMVDYTFSSSYRFPTTRGDEWKRAVGDNRLELVVDDKGEMKVIAGM